MGRTPQQVFDAGNATLAIGERSKALRIYLSNRVGGNRTGASAKENVRAFIHYAGGQTFGPIDVVPSLDIGASRDVSVSVPSDPAAAVAFTWIERHGAAVHRRAALFSDGDFWTDWNVADCTWRAYGAEFHECSVGGLAEEV
jgi:hypothetical protein